MPTNIPSWLGIGRRGRCRGFSLVELSMVLIVLGIIVSVVTAILPDMVRSARQDQTAAIVARAERAVVNFAANNHRLPCPDTDNDGVENINAGTGACSNALGWLPNVTLGLDYATDAAHQRMRYAVYNHGAINDSVIVNPDLTEQHAGRQQFCDALRDARLLGLNTDFVHTTRDLTPPATQSVQQAFVVVSGGMQDRDQDGALAFFDGRNEDNNLEFDFPGRVRDANYDDVVHSQSFADLEHALECSRHGSVFQFVTTSLPVALGSRDEDGNWISDDYHASVIVQGGILLAGGEYRWCVESTDMGEGAFNPSNIVSADCLAAEDSWREADQLVINKSSFTGPGTYRFTVFVRDASGVTPLTGNDNILTRQFVITVSP